MLHIIAWIACCMAGAFVGAAASLKAMGGGPDLTELGICGCVGGRVAVVMSAVSLAFLEDAPVWLKMLVGFAAACAVTAVATAVFVAGIYAG